MRHQIYPADARCDTTDQLKRAFSKHGRTGSAGYSHINHQSETMTSGDDQRPNGRPAADFNESTPLISAPNGLSSRVTHNANGKPYSEDERWWVRAPSSFVRLTWATLASNYVNVLLVTVPVGIVMGALDMNPTAVFIVNFLAIVPLAGLLSFATEEISVKLGQTLGGLMNATFGNAVELIVSRSRADST